TAGAVFLQLLVGAIMRHTNAGLAIPDFPLSLGRVVPPLSSFPVSIHFLHRVGAVIVAALVGVCAVRCVRSEGQGRRRAGLASALLGVVQISLGAATVLTKKSVVVTTAHVATGALLLGGTVALCVSSLAAERRRNNVIPIGSAIAGRASGWK